MSVSTPAKLSAQIDDSLKSVLVQVGQSLRAKSRLQSTLRLLQAKASSPIHQLSEEELIILQQYQGGPGQEIPGVKTLERECVRYDGLVKELGAWISSAKRALEQELERAKEREEVERVKREAEEKQREEQRLAEEARVNAEKEAEALRKAKEEEEEEEERKAKPGADVKMKEASKEDGSAIVIEDDDEDDDDVPLAGRGGASAEQTNGAGSAAIDLTDDSPAGGKQLPLPDQAPSNANAGMSLMADPTALLASLTNAGGSGEQRGEKDATPSTTTALDNFDFSQLGLQQMNQFSEGLQQMDGFNGLGANDGTNADFQSGSHLDGFSMDFLDFNAMGGGDDGTGGAGGGMVDSSNLFGNIDFGSILGGEAKGSGAGSGAGKSG